MPPRKNDVPRLFYDSHTLTIVVIALAKFGPLTKAELAAVCNLHVSRISRALTKLEKHGVSMHYAWGGPRPGPGGRWLRTTGRKIPPLHELDRGHPLFLRIGDLGRCLARSFSPPGTPAQGRRSYKGPKPVARVLSKEDLRLFGDTPAARVLYFFAWARNVPTRQLGETLGISKGITHTIKVLEQHEIVTTLTAGNRRKVNLNREFCAYWSLIEIGRAIDRMTGLEFKNLARSRRRKLALIKIRQMHKRAAIRRLAKLANSRYRR